MYYSKFKKEHFMPNQNHPLKYETVDISTPQKFNVLAKKYEVNLMAPDLVNYQLHFDFSIDIAPTASLITLIPIAFLVLLTSK